MISEPAEDPAVVVEGATHPGPFVLLCDHASNRIPERLGTLGLALADLNKHYAWDPGSLGVGRALAARLHAPLVRSTVSRLVIDCNRDPVDPDSIVTIGETTPIPGNIALDPAERARRITEGYTPYHLAVAALLDARRTSNRPSALISVHTFTPVRKGISRPRHIGLIHGKDATFALDVVAALRQAPTLVVGLNQPYAPSDRVFRSLEQHGEARGLPSIMIEIRSDLVTTPAEEAAWADRLAPILQRALDRLTGTNHAGMSV